MSLLPFVAVDVETANYDCTNICQFGYATFVDGALCAKDAFLVNPQCQFESRFKHIHGITSETVAGAPTWDLCQPLVTALLNSEILLSHTHFDRDALNKACQRYHLPGPMPRFWIDTCAVARRIWPDLPNHKLPTLAKHFGIAYSAHDAGEDARCAGEIFVRAVQASGEDMAHIMSHFITGHQSIRISQSVPKISTPIAPRPPAKATRQYVTPPRKKRAAPMPESAAPLSDGESTSHRPAQPSQNVQLQPPASPVPAALAPASPSPQAADPIQPAPVLDAPPLPVEQAAPNSAWIWLALAILVIAGWYFTHR